MYSRNRAAHIYALYVTETRTALLKKMIKIKCWKTKKKKKKMTDQKPPDKSIKYFSPGSFLEATFSSCACILNYTSDTCAGEKT